jgi:hypothetical protein
MELHKMGWWIGNGLGWVALGLALTAGIVYVAMSVASLLRHRHA